MVLFKVVFVALGLVAVANLMKVAVDWELQPRVYNCSEVSKADPVNVQLKCRRIYVLR